MTYRKVHGVGIFTGGTWCVGYLYTRLGWFNCSEPPRTSSNLFMAEKARRVECFHMSSGWFDYTEPSLPTGWNRVCSTLGRGGSTFTEASLTTSSREEQGVYGTHTLGRGGSIPANHLEPLHGRGNRVCRVRSNEFGVVRQYKLSLTTSSREELL